MVKILKEKLEIETSFSSTSIDEIQESHHEIQETITIKDMLKVITKDKQNTNFRTYKHIYKSSNSLTIKCCKWSKSETLKFYQMLQTYGTDFSLMCHSSVFQNKRSKKQLLNKYKKQSKINSQKIDQTLSKKTSKFMFDYSDSTPVDNLNSQCRQL